MYYDSPETMKHLVNERVQARCEEAARYRAGAHRRPSRRMRSLFMMMTRG